MFNHKFTRFLISIFVDFPIGVQYDYKKEETSDELSVADDHSDDFSLLEISNISSLFSITMSIDMVCMVCI